MQKTEILTILDDIFKMPEGSFYNVDKDVKNTIADRIIKLDKKFNCVYCLKPMTEISTGYKCENCKNESI